MSYKNVEDRKDISDIRKAIIHADNYDRNNPRLANMSSSQRENLADKFGPNWACIISGLGDQ